MTFFYKLLSAFLIKYSRIELLMRLLGIKFYSILFDTIILSLFLYGIEIWGSTLQKKYLNRIDKFFKRAHRFGYVLREYKVSELIETREKL